MRYKPIMRCTWRCRIHKNANDNPPKNAPEYARTHLHTTDRSAGPIGQVLESHYRFDWWTTLHTYMHKRSRVDSTRLNSHGRNRINIGLYSLCQPLASGWLGGRLGASASNAIKEIETTHK